MKEPIHDLILGYDLFQKFGIDIEEIKIFQHFVLAPWIMQKGLMQFELVSIYLVLELFKMFFVLLSSEFESVEIDRIFLNELDLVWDTTEVRVNHFCQICLIT